MSQHYQLAVDGMSCGGCVRAVRSIISKSMDLEPEQVDVDLEGKRASFDVDGEKDLSGLLTKLEKRGFPSQLDAS